MDGMGTANRSKAFHDVCWKKPKGCRVSGPHFLAQKLRPPNIRGTTYTSWNLREFGGGQNAAGAVLFHRSIQSRCRQQAAAMTSHGQGSWNEQWMVTPWAHNTRVSNIDNAARLLGISC